MHRRRRPMAERRVPTALAAVGPGTKAPVLSPFAKPCCRPSHNPAVRRTCPHWKTPRDCPHAGAFGIAPFCRPMLPHAAPARGGTPCSCTGLSAPGHGCSGPGGSRLRCLAKRAKPPACPHYGASGGQVVSNVTNVQVGAAQGGGSPARSAFGTPSRSAGRPHPLKSAKPWQRLAKACATA